MSNKFQSFAVNKSTQLGYMLVRVNGAITDLFKNINFSGLYANPSGDTTKIDMLWHNKRTTSPLFDWDQRLTNFVVDDQARFLGFSSGPNGFAIAGDSEQ